MSKLVIIFHGEVILSQRVEITSGNKHRFHCKNCGELLQLANIH
jgi:hypothetical protein